MPVIETPGGVNLHFDDVGSGRAMVLLHGWAMSGGVWSFQEPLAQGCRLVIPDLRGHGSSSTAATYTLEDYARDVAALFEQLDLKDAVLAGWSMGAQVALQTYPHLRSRLAAIVLVGGTPRFTTAEGYPHGKPPVEVKGMGLRLRRDYQRTMGDFFKGMFAPGEVDGEQYQHIVHKIVLEGRPPDNDAVLQSLRLLDSADLRDQLGEVECPVLLVHGGSDSVCPASASEYMAQKLPQATLKVMAGCGHAPFMTRPEAFNDVVRGFLRTLDR